MIGRTLSCIFSIAFVAPALFAQAQQPPTGGVAAGLGVQSIWGSIQNGDYGFFHYKGSEIEQQKLNEVFRRNEADKKFYLDYIASVNEGLDRLVAEIIMGVQAPSDAALKRPFNPNNEGESFVGLYNKYGVVGQMTPPQEFFGVVRKYNATRMALLNAIKGLSSLPQAAANSGIILESVDNRAGQQVKEIPQWGNLNFDSIVQFYQTQLEEADKYVTENLKLTIGTLPGGAVVTIPDASKFRISGPLGLLFETGALNLDYSQIEVLQKNALDLRRYAPSERDRVNAFTAAAKDLIQRFIEVYGTSERWRSQDGRNENTEGFKNMVKDIAEYFWARSFIRAEYGLPLGVIGVQYKKMIFGADLIFEKMDLKFYADPITRTADIDQIEQSIRNALNIMDQRAQAVTKGGRASQASYDLGGNVKADSANLSEKILQGDVSFLGRATSFLTWVNGKRPLANANLQILRLLAADLYEEREMVKNNLRGVNVSYAKRYFSNEEDKKYFSELESRFDPNGEKAAGNPEAPVDIFGDSGTIVSGTIAGDIKPVLQLATVRQSKLMQARNIEAQVEVLLQVKESVEQKKQQGRRQFRRGLSDSTLTPANPSPETKKE